MTITLHDFKVTGWDTTRQFEGYKAVYRHDDMGFIHDVVDIWIEGEIDIVFHVKAGKIVQDDQIQGSRLSYMLMSMVPVDKKFCVPAELAEWVEDVAYLIENKKIEFAAHVQPDAV